MKPKPEQHFCINRNRERYQERTEEDNQSLDTDSKAAERRRAIEEHQQRVRERKENEL